MNRINGRKLIVVVLVVALMLTSMTAVFAADSATLANADKAVTLKDLGLYSGQDANDPKVGLGNALTTQDSLIFLAKLFGYYDTASALSADQVAEALAKFDDAASISNYAKNVVAYSATNSIISGSTQNDKYFIGAKDTVTAARFATFMLNQMGYTVPDYKLSVAKLAETKGSKVDATLTGDLTRDAAIGVVYGTLTAEKASGKTVIADIVGDNADLKTKAEKAGLLIAQPSQTNDSKSDSSDSDSSGSNSSGSDSNGSDSENVLMEKAQLIAKNQIRVVFNKEMGSISVSDIVLTNLTTPSSINIVDSGKTTIHADGKTEVDLFLDKDLATDVTDEAGARIGITTIAAPSSVSVSGSKLASDYKIQLDDKIAPEIVKWDHDNDVSTPDIAKVIGSTDLTCLLDYGNENVPQDITGSITIFYSEAIKQSNLTVDTFNAPGFTITDITTSAESKAVFLTVRANANNSVTETITVTQVLTIYDAADNAFAGGATWEVMCEDKPVTY
ncbi:hypothetical protein CS063_07405 [Sporanaerobium hydrogeniformans]|uniref:Uncharacterized protein n=1 Tax=Sporanaerobium hydrogeniformans TaxID=3072179 RepID=A0AC61DDM1_9FIRM|nr:hypothetical protein [Sporanaerobium hydrogeniformans]PHV71148.1 hypothetical protein CS063_07405 [Sporanaerobium hydrogeniformans]